MSQRATGRTTRMLNRLIGELIAINDKPKHITIIAETQCYASDLYRRVIDVLKAYSCDDLFEFNKDLMEGNNCIVKFRGYSHPANKHLSRDEITYYDHYIGHNS